MIALLSLVVALTLAQEPSIALDQAGPVYGDSVTFTAVYPKEATRRVGRQQMVNPAVQVDCYQSGTWVFRGNNGFVKDSQAGDGMLTGTSGPIVLGAPGNENSWTGGAASCSATLFYFGHDELIHVLAQAQFDVGA